MISKKIYLSNFIIKNYLNITLFLITILIAYVFPVIHSSLAFREYQKTKQLFYQPIVWQTKCSNNQRYCLYIITQGKSNKNKLIQKVILNLIDIKERNLLLSKQSTYIFQTHDLEGYKLNQFIVNRYKRKIIKSWLKNDYLISNKGKLLIKEKKQ
ncbi:MAG: hypothetical protein ACRC80_01495 [Waterburya sp.]